MKPTAGRGVAPRSCIRGCQRRTLNEHDEIVTVPRPATEGWLCTGCYCRLLDWLDDLPQIIALLPEVVEPGSLGRSAEALGKIKRNVDPPAPVRLDVLAATDDRSRPDQGDGVISVRSVVVAWCDYVARLDTPSRNGQRGRWSIDAGCLYLRAHLRRLVDQTSVERAYTDLELTYRYVAGLIGETKAKPIGHCPSCGHTLWLPPTHYSGVRCRGCGNLWPTSQLLGLSAALSRDGTITPG